MKHNFTSTFKPYSTSVPISFYDFSYSPEFLRCIKWRLLHKEFEQFSNGTIFHWNYKYMNFSYDLGEYKLESDGSAYVCVPNKFTPWLYFLDYIGILVRCLSILALLVSIAVDLWIVRDVRSKRLRPIVCHKISLVIFYACSCAWNGYFCGRFKDITISKIVATLFIYAERSAYCWINVISFDMWRTFDPVTIIRRPTMVFVSRTLSLHRFTCQCLYAWGLPLILVAACHLFRLLNLPIKKEWIHFGLLFCNSVQIGFNTVTVILILLLNTLFCILIIRNLRANRRHSNHHMLNSDGNKELFPVYIKLVGVSGFLLVFFQLGQFAIVYKGGYFFPRLIFDWLANAQGLWLCIIYSCNASVRKQAKKKLQQYFPFHDTSPNESNA